MLSPAVTQHGVILGTAAYMSPEQARGQVVDKRADIWAFGVVLYEMLSGRTLFAGDTVSDTIAEVLKRDIDLSSIPPDTPHSLRRVIARCLERDPRRRLRDIGDASYELSAPEAPTAAAPPPARRASVVIAGLAAIAAAAAAAGLTWWLTRPAPRASRRRARRLRIAWRRRSPHDPAAAARDLAGRAIHGGNPRRLGDDERRHAASFRSTGLDARANQRKRVRRVLLAG